MTEVAAGITTSQPDSSSEDSAGDERVVELSSIAAIFPEVDLSAQGNLHYARLDLKVSPTSPAPVYFSVGEPLEPGDTTQPVYLEHLPPLQIYIELPAGYPQYQPPRVNVQVEHDWLPHHIVLELIDLAAQLWTEYGQSQIIFAYIDHLQQLAETTFGVGSQSLRLPSALREPLLQYQSEVKQHRFDAQTFMCGVCLEPKRGNACHCLASCEHVFCKGCLLDCFNAAIVEGEVIRVKCPSPGCGNKKMTHPRELISIGLERSLVQRYVDIRLKRQLEADKSTVYCPRIACGAPARSAAIIRRLRSALEDYPSDDEEAADEAANEDSDYAARLAVCSRCTLAFCRVCTRSWHGDFVNCRPPGASMTADDLATYEYLSANTSECPTCGAPCSKMHGCNHMICGVCFTHFCYLCTAWLPAGNPYRHFNLDGTPCYMRLWEGEAGDGPGDGPGEGPWQPAAAAVAAAEAAEEAAAAEAEST